MASRTFELFTADTKPALPFNEVKDIVFSGDSAEVIVGSGVEIARLLMDGASRDLGGLEFMFGIPGTLGGAVYGNAGAFGHAIGDFVKSVTLLIPGNESRKTKIVRHSGKWCMCTNLQLMPRRMLDSTYCVFR